MKSLNLDKILPEQKEVILNGVSYLIPGSIPVENQLGLMKYAEKLQMKNNDAEAMLGAVHEAIKVLQILNDNVDIEILSKKITLEQYTSLVTFFSESGEEQPLALQKEQPTTESV